MRSKAKNVLRILAVSCGGIAIAGMFYLPTAAQQADDAETVADNAACRTDMKWITICSNKPTLRAGVYYQVMPAEDCQRWHQPGGFANLRR